MIYYAIHENEYEIFIEAIEANSREEARELLERNDTNMLILSEIEMKNLIDSLPLEPGEMTVI